MDPKAELDALDRARSAVEVVAFMPEIPRWYAPLLGALVVSISVMLSGPGLWRILAAIIVVATGLITNLDHLRRRRAKPRSRQKPRRIGILFASAAVATSVILQTLTAVLSPSFFADSSDARILTMLAIAWVVTAAVFAVGITATERMRSRWLEGR